MLLPESAWWRPKCNRHSSAFWKRAAARRHPSSRTTHNMHDKRKARTYLRPETNLPKRSERENTAGASFAISDPDSHLRAHSVPPGFFNYRAISVPGSDAKAVSPLSAPRRVQGSVRKTGLLRRSVVSRARATLRLPTAAPRST